LRITRFFTHNHILALEYIKDFGWCINTYRDKNTYPFDIFVIFIRQSYPNYTNHRKLLQLLWQFFT